MNERFADVEPVQPLDSGVIHSTRSPLAVLATLLVDPLKSFPPEAFTAKMVVSHAFGATRAYLCDPALIHQALVKNADALAKSDDMKRVLGPALGNGLLTADGASWRWQRQALAPAFQHEKLTALIAMMIVAAEATRDRLLALPQGSTVDIGHEMMLTTFQIVVDTMLSGPEGMDAARVERGVSAYLNATPWMFVMALLKAPRWMPFPGRRRAEAANRLMRGTVRARFVARRAADTGAADLIGMLLAAVDPETGRAMTDEEITDNILTFIAAGHETTAIALGWAFALLSANPACTDRLLAEIEAVTGGGPVLPAHIADLAYARQIVSEAMRLYPPAPLIARMVQREIEIAGVTLAKGTVIFVPIYAVHRHEALWSRPESFDPDRFAPDETRARHRFAYLPFGAGPRICIGSSFATMEAVAILAILVKAMRLDLIDPVPPHPDMRVTLRPKRALRMRVGRRV